AGLAHGACDIRGTPHLLAGHFEDDVALPQTDPGGGAAGIDFRDLDAVLARREAQAETWAVILPGAAIPVSAAGARVGGALGKRLQLDPHRLLAAIAEVADLRLTLRPQRCDPA